MVQLGEGIYMGAAMSKEKVYEREVGGTKQEQIEVSHGLRPRAGEGRLCDGAKLTSAILNE